MADIKNIFVLMLENRSFDHMLGFSGIRGVDAVTGKPVAINGLTGAEFNQYLGQNYPAAQPALSAMPADPAHEFPDVLRQLCGDGAVYPARGAYPGITNSGFVGDYAAVNAAAAADPGEIMKGFAPTQLPVLNALARAFAVCDNWYASLPGPTWPNRFFAAAASSGGLDHSPSSAEIAKWDTIDGYSFPNGTIFDRLGVGNWRIFAGDHFPIFAGLKGIQLDDISPYAEFAAAVADSGYATKYTFIEPNYGDFLGGTYRGGNSQHPLDGITGGEALIKSTYEAIRNSPLWNNSLLIITWDEHGGFYDHAVPPATVAPGDTQPGAAHNQYGFTFEQYGVRVPAVVVSPLIPAGLIDHRIYDHSSIPATIEAVFGLEPLTERDKHANHLQQLLTLAVPRSDAPSRLPDPAVLAASAAVASQPDGSSIDGGNLPGMLHAAMRQDLQIPGADREAIKVRVEGIKTRAEARAYFKDVATRVRDRAAP